MNMLLQLIRISFYYSDIDSSMNIISTTVITDTTSFQLVQRILIFTGGVGGENNNLPQITSFTSNTNYSTIN